MVATSLCDPALAANRDVKFAADGDIQTYLIAQFPTGTYVPNLNNIGVPFKIPVSKPKIPIWNYWDPGVDLQPLSVNLAVRHAAIVYMLIAAVSPPAGQVVANVAINGSKGAQFNMPLVAGVDIRDFCETIWANTINGTTTQPAFEVDNVMNPCGLHTYHIDEITLTLPNSFTAATLQNITVTPTGNGRPLVLGIAVNSR